MNYFELEFKLNPLLPAKDVLIAELAEIGFESFMETELGVKAYIREPDFRDELLDKLLTKQIPELDFSYTAQVIKDQNWNAEWEKNFDPIIVDERCLIRAPFHKDLPDFEVEIIIEPKMSFGTGHHATTYLIIAEMLKMDFKGKKVLDMGSGTGVLAIFAEKRGASMLDAIDIDEWAFENSVENVERNNCVKINVIQGGAEEIPEEEKYDVVLANINRNILVRDVSQYVNAMSPGAEILFSGFYLIDVPEVAIAASKCGLNLKSQQQRGEWCMLHFHL